MEQLRMVAEALEHMRQVEATVDGRQIYEAMGRVRQAIIAFGAALAPGDSLSLALLDQFEAQVYPALRGAYQVAGDPYGPDDDGVVLWLREQAAIAAEAEHRDQERAWQRGLAAVHQLLAARQAAEPPPAGAESVEARGQF